MSRLADLHAHGTKDAIRRHRKHDEPLCDLCLIANRRIERERKARNRRDPLPEEISMMRAAVMCGESKASVARRLGFCRETVLAHTADIVRIPPVKPNPADGLEGGRWVRRGLILRWMPSPLPNAMDVVERLRDERVSA